VWFLTARVRKHHWCMSDIMCALANSDIGARSRVFFFCDVVWVVPVSPIDSIGMSVLRDAYLAFTIAWNGVRT
jgi:hypothetical protein